MTQKTEVTTYDDLAYRQQNQVLADETVEFGLDGRRYEIDLCEENAARLRDALAPFVAHGRRVSPSRATRRARVTEHAPTNHELNAAIREWARGQGMKVEERGRISSAVVEAYHKAH